MRDRRENYRSMSCPRLRILFWIRLSMRPSTRSRPVPVLPLLLSLGVDHRKSSFNSLVTPLEASIILLTFSESES